jgi:glycine/D-amino acid oxidase-like deaminating enzyme
MRPCHPASTAFAPRVLERQRERAEVATTDAMREIDAGEARDLFPPLAAVRRALWNPRGARVDGREITNALHEAAVARGVRASRDRSSGFWSSRVRAAATNGESPASSSTTSATTRH